MDFTNLNEDLWCYLKKSADYTRIYNHDETIYIEKFSTPNDPIVIEVLGYDEGLDYDVSIKNRQDISQVVCEFQRLGGSLSDIKQAIVWIPRSEQEAEELISSLPADWPKGSDDDSIEQTVRRLEESDGIDEEILETLAYSPYWRIRRAVALSPSCSSTFIEKLKLKKVKEHSGVNPDETILQAIRERSLPSQWRIEDTNLLIERVKSEEVPVPVLEVLALHYSPYVLESVVRSPGVKQFIIDQIYQRCMLIDPTYRFANVLSAISEITSGGSTNTNTHSSEDQSRIIGSKELIASLEPACLQLLFNALAVAGVEDVISRDQSEVWTLLGENEPQDYDYDADSHTETIERATILLAQELGEAFQSGHEQFDSMVKINRGYLMFWEKLSDGDVDVDIDSFSEVLDRILEDIS